MDNSAINPPFDPRPGEGRWFRFWRGQGIGCDVEPIYDNATPMVLDIGSISKFDLIPGKYWFLTVDVGIFHFYIGWKRINLQDPRFYWRELLPKSQWDRVYLQKSARFGLNNTR